MILGSHREERGHIQIIAKHFYNLTKYINLQIQVVEQTITG